MVCEFCGEKPKNTAKDFTKAVIEINNPEQIILFRKVVIPTSMGDDTTVPPAIGKYRNVLLVYEANNHAYLYSSDGIPTLLTSDVAQDLEQKIDAVAKDLQTEVTARENADTALDNRLTTVEGIAATALQPEAIDKVVMTDISLNPNTSTTTVQIDGAKENLLTGATATKNIPLPVASHTEAGVMNSSTFDAVTNNTSNISALMGGAVAITGLSASPSQSDLTTAWQTETGLTTLMNRAGIYDVDNNKVWTYYSNTSTWYAASNTSQVTINTFTNNSEGTIKGSTNVGQVFAENDGTGSVNGWDTLSGAVSTNTSNITSLQTAVAGKQDKLTAGTNITISPTNVISATGTSYTAGNAITIENNTINADIYPADFFTNDATNTDTGSNITLDKTIPGTLKSVGLYGDTEQQTYSGKNLVNTPDDTRSSGGLDIVWSDNICTFSGTASSTSAILTSLTTLDQNLPQGTYVFSIQEATTYSIRLSVLNADTSGYMNYDIPAGSTSVTININYNTISYRIAAKDWSNGDSVSGTLKQPMFEAGSTPTDYEPYVGGIPAPNPDYPQPVNVVTGEQTVTVSGKNLFNKNGGNILTAYFDNATTAITSNANNRTIFIPCLPNTTYSLQKLASPYARHIGSTSTVPSIGTSVNILGNFEPNSTTKTITTDNNAKYLVVRLWSSAQDSSTIEQMLASVQIEAGPTPTAYEPYQSQSYTVDLGATELCKIGDYQDYIYKSGDDWYVHKAVGKIIFDGSAGETWTRAATLTSGVYKMEYDGLSGLYVHPSISTNPIMGYCSHFGPKTETQLNNLVVGFSGNTAGTKIFIYNPDHNTTATDFKTWLSTHNVTLYYALVTPTDTQITDATLIEQLDALANASTYLDTTIFTVSTVSPNLRAVLNVDALAKSLDGVIAAIPKAQVQADWTEVDTTAADYIKNKPTIPAAQVNSDWNANSGVAQILNKPTIPTVNDATLTIQQNGVDVATFTANSSTNATANITSPVITMTSTDPGEGSALAANNFIGVYVV